uniref:Uncharacterized protein n=1 Tax=Cacopsylla melanoneura TaxID=428564 RepID=A0A8D9F273_9HEMI
MKTFMIGDSQTKRLINNFYGKNPLIRDWALSGAKAEDVFRLVYENVKSGDKPDKSTDVCTIWVGTNDVLKYGTLEEFKSWTKKLITYCKKMFKRIFLVLLPPILQPRPNNINQCCMNDISKYLTSFSSQELIRIVSLTSISDVDLFEEHIGHKRRVDCLTKTCLRGKCFWCNWALRSTSSN